VIVGVTDALGVIVGVTEIEGVVVLVTLGVGVGVATITVGGIMVGSHQFGFSASKSLTSIKSEESHNDPEHPPPSPTESLLDPGAFPESKHPPLIKNPFVLVIVKSKFKDTVEWPNKGKDVDLLLNTALSITYLNAGVLTLSPWQNCVESGQLSLHTIDIL